jgi:hypothetical protein
MERVKRTVQTNQRAALSNADQPKPFTVLSFNDSAIPQSKLQKNLIDFKL